VDGVSIDDTAATVLSGALVRAQSGALAGEQVGSYDISQGTLAADSNHTMSFTGSTLTIAPATLTTTAKQGSKVYGTNDPTLTDTAVGFVDGTVDGVSIDDTAATVLSGAPARAQFGTIAGEQAGEFAITQGTLAADSNYTISLTSTTLSITRAALTVTANPVTKVYGTNNPILTYSAAGFVDTTVDGVPIDDTTSTALSGQLARAQSGTLAGEQVGGYDISQGTLTASNYTISFTGSTLTIAPATLAITADDQTKTYGAAFTFAATAFTTSGLVNGDTVTGVTLTSAATEASAGVSGSPYPIIPSAAGGTGLGNYTITYAAGTFTVNPAPLTITANNASNVAGQPNPTFSVEYTGFVLGQGPSTLGGTLTLSTPASATSPAGSYPIVPGGLSSSNYAIAYQDGTLVVNPPFVTVASLGWQTVKLHHGKNAKDLVVGFSGALESDRAIDLAAFTLDSAKRRGKVTTYNTRVPLASATYNPATNTVTLALRGNPAAKAMELTIDSALVLDAYGRPIDGALDGQPGGDFVAVLNRHGVISMVRTATDATAARAARAAIDAVIADGELPRTHHTSADT